MNYQLSIIGGLHRSGTTYVGKIIEKAGATVVHEPLNPNHGVQDVPLWYPFIDIGNRHEYNELEILLDNIVHLHSHWLKKPRQAVNIKKLIYYTVGSPQRLKWIFLKLRNTLHQLPEYICWKDPFATFLIEFLIRHYRAKILCMVRHPGALYHSISNKNWLFDIHRLTRQKRLIEKYGKDIQSEHWKLAKHNNVASIALLWKIMSRLLFSLQNKYPELMVLKHEDFCREPLIKSQQFCKHLGLPFNERIKQFVIQTTSAPSSFRKIDYFTRDTKSLINTWRSKIDPEVSSILQNLIGNELYFFYNQW